MSSLTLITTCKFRKLWSFYTTACPRNFSSIKLSCGTLKFLHIMYFPYFNSIFLLLSTVSSVQSPLLLSFAFDNLAKQLRLVILKIITMISDVLKCLLIMILNYFTGFWQMYACVHRLSKRLLMILNSGFPL